MEKQDPTAPSAPVDGGPQLCSDSALVGLQREKLLAPKVPAAGDPRGSSDSGPQAQKPTRSQSLLRRRHCVVAPSAKVVLSCWLADGWCRLPRVQHPRRSQLLPRRWMACVRHHANDEMRSAAHLPLVCAGQDKVEDAYDALVRENGWCQGECCVTSGRLYARHGQHEEGTRKGKWPKITVELGQIKSSHIIFLHTETGYDRNLQRGRMQRA